MAIDYTKLMQKLSPEDQIGGDPGLDIRVGKIKTINSTTGHVTLTLSGVDIPDVPVLGGAVFAVGTVVQVLSYRGSLLILGASNVAASLPPENSGGSVGTTTSTTFTETLTPSGGGQAYHGVVFIAPPSGTVKVEVRAAGGNNGAGGYILLDWQVRTGGTFGSGTIVRAANESTAGIHESAVASYQDTTSSGGLVTGLAPGAVYNAVQTYRVTGGTGEYNRRYILVTPF